MRPAGPLFLLVLLGSGAVQAGPRLASAPSPAADRGVLVERAAVRGAGVLVARGVLEVASRPLTLTGAGQEADVPVDRLAVVHAQAAWLVAHRAALTVSLPFGSVGGGPPGAGGPLLARHDGWSLADAELGGRLVLAGSGGEGTAGAALAASFRAWLPTGAGYLGDDRASWRLSLLAEGEGERWEGGAAAGFHDRRERVLPGLLPTRDGAQLTLGAYAGFALDPGRRMFAGWEAEGRFGVGAGTRLLDPRSTTAHVLGALRWRLPFEPFEVGVAAGPGAFQGVGAADLRVLGSLRMATESAAPPADADGDGIADALDACPDRDGVPSEQPLLRGCPEQPPDADGDAIPDALDACPRAPGEATGERATHGCPAPLRPAPAEDGR